MAGRLFMQHLETSYYNSVMQGLCAGSLLSLLRPAKWNHSYIAERELDLRYWSLPWREEETTDRILHDIYTFLLNWIIYIWLPGYGSRLILQDDGWTSFRDTHVQSIEAAHPVLLLPARGCELT